jgi:predicted phosphodiesterase
MTHRLGLCVPAILLTTSCAPGAPDVAIVPFTAQKRPLAQPVRLLLGSDAHDNLPLMRRFVAEANKARPDLVVNVGDTCHFGVEREWRAVDPIWADLERPLAFVSGNHERKRQARRHIAKTYGKLPRSLDVKGLHIVLLDNSNYELSHQLDFLERDLALHSRQRTLVVMHVPVTITPGLEWLAWHDAFHQVLPGREAHAFSQLIKRYRVDAVINGHNHWYGIERPAGGIPTIHVGSIGGYLPALGQPHGYLAAEVTDKGVQLRFHALAKAPENMVALVKSGLSIRRMTQAVSGGMR